MSPDIAARIQRDFSSSAARREAHFAVASLEGAVKQLDRITRCVLYLADGNLESLASYIKAAMQDYRDVIWWAEYDREDREKRIRDFNLPFDMKPQSIISAKCVAPICGSGDLWKVAEPSDSGPIAQRAVSLTIEGDERGGYHLVMSPEGCFTADTWHASKSDALESAEQLFGIPHSAWRSTESEDGCS
jgi:hypothetical protein